MKKINFSQTATLYENISELNSEDQTLMDSAREAIKNAYAPYSKFNVGCSILLQNGKIVSGSNQENAAYPSGMCAERVAIWKKGSEYPNELITKIAITVKSEIKKVDQPVGPCGACRQTLSEYEINQKEPIEIIFMGETGAVIKAESILSLLPFSFNSSHL